jgi:ABC-type sugar transport system ATPase subunit
MGAEAAIEAVGVRKSFGGVTALADANLRIEPGTVHGLVGHNGAGKSTLVNILAGVLKPDAGHLAIHGDVVALESPRDALGRGIGVVFQELALWPDLTVAANISLGTGGRGDRALLDRPAMRATAVDALRRVGMTIDPATPISDLAFSDQQLVALARLAHLKPKILILDEPTSGLGPDEVRRLGRLLREMTAEGVAVLFISHRLREMLDLADVVTVFRDGRDIATVQVSETTSAGLVELMMGSPLATGAAAGRTLRPVAVDAAPVLTVEPVTYRGRLLAPRLEVRAGEIVGVLGLPGSGREALLYALAGDPAGGRVARLSIGGRSVRANPWELRRAGLGFVPSDRLREGVLPTLSIGDNIAVGAPRSRIPLRGGGEERALTASLVRRLRVRLRSVSDPITSLSGGNQQKAIFARALAARSRVLILDEPTNGVDVGSREEIHRVCTELGAEGMALVIGSSDPEELIGLCHRILVVHAGEHAGEFQPPHDVTELMVAATGGARPSTPAHGGTDPA